MQIDQVKPRTNAVDPWLACHFDMAMEVYNAPPNNRGGGETLRRSRIPTLACTIHFDFVLFEHVRKAIGPQILEQFDKFHDTKLAEEDEYDLIKQELSGIRDLWDDRHSRAAGD